MADDIYELTPRKEIEFLRREVERMKRTPLGEAADTSQLVSAIMQLNNNIVHLNQILEGANDEMVRTFHDTSVQEMLRKMLEQDEKLARGIVALADMIKDQEQKHVQPQMPAANPFLQPPVSDIPPPPRGY